MKGLWINFLEVNAIHIHGPNLFDNEPAGGLAPQDATSLAGTVVTATLHMFFKL